MNPTYGIALKVASTLLFMIMAACIKLAAERVPAGELVFARSAIGIIPILVMLAWRSELKLALHTKRLPGHLWRGVIGTTSMFAWFMSLYLLPLPEAIALNFTAPLITVVLSVFILGEVVRTYRWSAVIVGFIGVLVVLAPRLDVLTGGQVSVLEFAGAGFALLSALSASLAMIQVRTLIASETTGSIVVYFCMTASSLALLTLPFGWVWPTPHEMLLLVAAGLIGGVGQVLMTESYRYAETSTIATFDYASMLWSLLIGWLVFGDIAPWTMLAGSAIIVGSGIFIIIRERQLGRPQVPTALKP